MLTFGSQSSLVLPLSCCHIVCAGAQTSLRLPFLAQVTTQVISHVGFLKIILMCVFPFLQVITQGISHVGLLKIILMSYSISYEPYKVCRYLNAFLTSLRCLKAKSYICVPPPQAMSALSDAPTMRSKGAYNKIPKSTSSEGSYDLLEASLPDELHAGSWRCVGTSNPIVNGIEESNEEIANLLEGIPPQFEAEWVSKGDLYIKVFKLFSYSHSSYVS